MGIFGLGKKPTNSADRDKRDLPFLHTIGYEKTYGVDRKDNPNLLVSQYKSWVYACIQRIAFSIANTKLAVYKQSFNVKEGEVLTEIPQHPFMELLNSVNPFFNRRELMMLTDIFLETTGNAYWWMPRGILGTPAVIWNIPSPWIKPIPSKTKFIEGYALKPPQEAKPIFMPEEEIVHFKYPSPFDLWNGTSPTLAAAYGIDLNNNIKQWGISFFMNNAQPSGILTTDDNINNDMAERLRTMWNKMHRGSNKAGKTAILGGGLKYQKMGSALGEMAFQDIARSIRDEVLAMYGVPASILGLVEDVNRANAEANEYTFAKYTVLPRVMLIEEKINEKIMPMYDAALKLKFENPVPEDKEFRLRERAENIRMGYSSIDDERKVDGLDPYDMYETNRPLIPFSVQPARTEDEKQEAEDQMAEQMQGNNTPQDQDDEQDDKNKPKDEKIMTKANRQRHAEKWRRFKFMQEPIEKLFEAELSAYFGRQFREIISNLMKYKSFKKDISEGLIGSIMFNMTQEVAALSEDSAKYVETAYLAGITLGQNDLGMFEPYRPVKVSTVRKVKSRIDKFATEVNNTTLKLVAGEIQKGAALGETADQVADRIQRVAQYTKEYRAKTVARTEVVGAMNEANLDFYHEAGIESKQWVTSGDGNVRESHQNMQKREAKINEPFITGLGSYMQYPCDRESSPPAEDVVNCRCTVIHGEV